MWHLHLARIPVGNHRIFWWASTLQVGVDSRIFFLYVSAAFNHRRKGSATYLLATFCGLRSVNISTSLIIVADVCKGVF